MPAPTGRLQINAPRINPIKDYFPCNLLSWLIVFPLPLPWSPNYGASGRWKPQVTKARPWLDLRKIPNGYNTQDTVVTEIVNKTENRI